MLNLKRSQDKAQAYKEISTSVQKESLALNFKHVGTECTDSEEKHSVHAQRHDDDLDEVF